jgi:hypothetical protein
MCTAINRLHVSPGSHKNTRMTNTQIINVALLVVLLTEALSA